MLWIERVSPFAPVGDLDDETLDRLVATARRLLLANAARPRPERVTTAGDRGAPGSLYVYGRTGRPCRRCRTPIASAQPGHRAPADDLLVPDLPACDGCNAGPGDGTRRA